VEGIPGNPTSGNPFGADVQKRILNSTVKISGTGWDTSSSFSGSAVIYKVDATYAYVLSAAHNIMVWANIEQKPDDWKKYIDGDNSHNGFVKNVKISYGKGNMTFNLATGESAAEIFSVEVPEVNHDCRTDNCLYDLIAIKSKNNALRTYAKEYVFGKRTYEQIATAVAAEATQVKQSFAAFLNPKKYFFVQLGYGDIE